MKFDSIVFLRSFSKTSNPCPVKGFDEDFIRNSRVGEFVAHISSLES